MDIQVCEIIKLLIICVAGLIGFWLYLSYNVHKDY